MDRIPHTTPDGSGTAGGGSGSGRTTHFSVCCSSCGAVVGRLYSEVPPALEPISHLFCLEVSRCASYELGSAEMRAPVPTSSGSAQAQQQQEAAAAAGRLGSSGEDGQRQRQAGDAGTAAGVDDSLVLELLQRVEQLEASLCTVGGRGVCVLFWAAGSMCGFNRDVACLAHQRVKEGKTSRFHPKPLVFSCSYKASKCCTTPS